MSGQGRKPIVFLGSVVALGSAAWLLLGRLASVSAGPEAEILEELKKAEHDLPAIAVGNGAVLQPHRMQFQRLNVQVERDSDVGFAAGTLDLDGQVGDVVVSTLGWERVVFERKAGSWGPSSGWAPRLAMALQALEARRAAIDSGNLAALKGWAADPGDAGYIGLWAKAQTLQKRRFRAEAWYLRSERDRIGISEEWRLTGDTADRPVDERGKTSLVLKPRDGGFFFETDAL